MKQRNGTLWAPVIALMIASVVMAGCSSQSQPERAAARQTTAGQTSVGRAATAVQEATMVSATEPTNSGVQLVKAAGPAAAAQDADGNVEAGKETFEQCGVCHNVDSDEAKMGPSLQGLFKKEKLTNGKPANLETITTIIKQGGNGMPGYEDLLEADEMKNLIAYLRTI
ncbi:MAG: cytochrome c [Bryobacterales bacterium]|jgi:mono/diheme cytochrome c family protein|nr:cytochrome c [Bryobacterales bacterium]